MNVVVLIPAYNEEERIGSIVADVRAKGMDVLVIDDGSSDDTGKIAARAGAVLLSHKQNLGKGASLKQGFDFILKHTVYDNVLIMDGDGQHKLSDVPRFIEKRKSGTSDIIVGNRMEKAEDMPFIRRITNQFMSGLLSRLCGQRIPDTQCGFRLLSREVIGAITLKSDRYDTESEMLIDASRKGFRIDSVPIATVYSGQHSDIHPIKDALRFIRLLIKTR